MRKEKNKNKDKSLSQILKEIESNIDILKDYPDDSVKKSAENLSVDLKEGRKAVRGLNTFLAFVTSIAVIAVIFSVIISAQYTNLLKERNDTLFKRVKYTQDSLKDKLLNISKNDSLSEFSYYVDDKGRPITYGAMVRKRDSVINILYDKEKEIVKLQDSVGDFKIFKKVLYENYGIILSKRNEGNSIIYSAKSKKLTKYIEENESFYNKARPLVKEILKHDTVRRK
ncbi:hypothetical protein C8J95_102334 [Elizabethkingia sp. YR214]|uniref:hypothetical protein n=1 Tax=Elizabethkingia sp. YR214 TaxID=2135667 RepID=UPI000D32406A|nr:hypothetical protein [Elizabethkingia sp. YR214]PUB34668.1 hypothetical protein C8J95_102334 [Elizabethkingia sp. YR214]